jgi:acyl-homoserine lactone acylase PvdQ
MEISRRPRDHQGYRLIYTPFLKSTGLTHLGKDDIAAATRLLPHWGEIDDWRSSLPISYQEQLNNPRSVEKAWKRERGREIVPVSRARIPGHHRESPSLLEEKVALENQLQAEREQAEFRESELHAVIQELAKRYSIDDDTLSEITAEVRARYEEK